MSDLAVAKRSVRTDELVSAIRCYQAETNQIASLLAYHSNRNRKIDRKLLTHVLGTTNSYLDSILSEIVANK